MIPLPPFIAAAVVAATLVMGMAGCEMSQLARPPIQSLPRWQDRACQVFDDNIDPAAVGLSLDSASPGADMLLRERAQTADLVARVRVQTVTVDSLGDQKTYHFVVQVQTPTLTTPRIPDRSFELTIRSTSGAFGIARAFDTRLRDQTFIAFFKRYAADDNELEVHWHLAADTAEFASAIKEAVTFPEFRGL